jgi:ferritin-like metal-binding protein YciE
MEKMNDLRDLLRHEIQDLYSAEEQIIKAMPDMIDKAKNPELKKALQDHLRVTERQKTRLDQVMQRLEGSQRQGEATENKGLFSRLMSRRRTCRGMEGILKEGEDILSEDMNSEVMDAAIIACAQKVEHYEICGYGTVKAYARELNLIEVENLLDQTLQEEYNADDLMTQIAVGRLNREAESAGGARSRTAAAGQSGTTARSEGGRATTRERARIDEPEMEMARGRRTTGTSGRTQGAADTTGGRTTGTAGRTGTPSRTAAGRGDTASRTTPTRGTTGAAGTTRGITKATGTTGRTTGTTGRTTGATGRTTGTTGTKGTTSRGGTTRSR